MSHTYQSCYKVIVPPVDLYHQSRRSGVRLRSSCAPLNELKDFDVLYLPEQLRANHLEAEADQHQRRLKPAPGWVENAQHELDQKIARQQYRMARESEFGSDAGLNGSIASKARFALRNEFVALRGADGTILHTVRYQRGGRQTRRGSVDRLDDELSPTNSLMPNAHDPLGDGHWMRMEPKAASLPRSTTHSTYRHILEDSFLLDRQSFHGPKVLPPPTPCFDSNGAVRPLSPASSTQVIKRIPLNSNDQPSLFLQTPNRLGHQETWRESRFLRHERETERKLLSADGRRRESTGTSSTFSLSPPHIAPFSPHSARRPSTVDPSRSRISSVGSQTSRLRPTPSMNEVNLSTNPNISIASINQDRTHTNLSKFQLHMQQARQRWKEQGIITATDEKEQQ